MNLLQHLNLWLQSHNLYKEADEVKELTEYEEPWYEEAVTEFGSEPITEEEYIDQNFPPKLPEHDETYKAILQKENFKPLDTGTQPVLAGSGVFGKVFRGIYQGKPAVAKISLDSKDRDDEVDNWRAILQAYKSMPKELQKHIPTVYATKKGSIDDIGYQFVVMEELKPLSKHLMQTIELTGKTAQQNINRLLKDENYLYQIAQLILKGLRINYEFQHNTALQAITASDIFKMLYELGTLVYNSENYIASELSSKLATKYQLDKLTARKIKISIFGSIVNAFGSAKPLPRGLETSRPEHSDYTPYWENIPETQNLMKMLKVLYQSFNISYGDLHYNNIMMGNDGNLKIIDVGRYTDHGSFR